MDGTHMTNYYAEEFSTLGERISVARERAGLSQEDVARSLAVNTSTLDNWEGDSSEPRANKLSMLAGLLGVSPTWLLHGVGEGVSPPDQFENDTVDDTALRERLLAELRSAQEMNAQLQRKIERIVDALSAIP